MYNTKFVFPDLDFDYPNSPKLQFDVRQTQLVRRSFPNLQEVQRKSFPDSSIMQQTSQQDYDELRAYIDSHQPAHQTPFPVGQPELTLGSFKYYEPEQDDELYDERLFKVINADENEIVINGRGERIYCDYLKKALTWSKDEKSQRVVYVNKNQYKVILKRRKRRLEKRKKLYGSMNFSDPNSATATINSATNSVNGAKKNYKYESRHKHAKNRKRDHTGKFVKQDKTKQIEEQMISQIPIDQQNQMTLQQMNMNQTYHQNGLYPSVNGNMNMLSISMIEPIQNINALPDEEQLQQHEMTNIIGNDQQIGMNGFENGNNEQTLTEIQNVNDISIIPQAYVNQMNGNLNDINQMRGYSQLSLNTYTITLNQMNTSYTIDQINPSVPLNTLSSLTPMNNVNVNLPVEQLGLTYIYKK